MGLLKLSSIYKKNKKKDAQSPPPVSTPPKIEPVSLELNLDFNNTSTINNKSSIIEQPRQQQNVPAGPGSLFDDIFAELKTTPIVTQEDTIEHDFSLALALTQQLSLENSDTKEAKGTSKPSKYSERSTTNNSKLLLGEDSIYSSYLRNMSAIESPNDSTFSTSMFDSLINKSSIPASASTPTASNTAIATTTVTTQVVLDSDISDTDEESKHSDESEEEVELSNQDSKRMTKGVQPIMDRRGPNLSVQRKIDSWSNRLDTGGNVNESVIERMKDRHRHQVKLAALRQQHQQNEYTTTNNNTLLFGNQHMVPQAYVAPTVSIPQNIVLPHPGVLMDTAQIFYPPISQDNMSPLPNHPEHMRMEAQKSPSDRSSPNNSNASSLNNSSATLPSVQEYESGNESPSNEIPSNRAPINEEFAAEADAESSEDEQQRKSNELRKQRSMKKLRQKSGDNDSRQIRSSRSTPNLKKKQSSKKSSKANSRSSSRRNSNDLTSSPSSDQIKTPPPLPYHPHEFMEYQLPRSNSHQQISSSTRSVRQMKSEPEFSQRHNQQQHYQQQLNSEWERMQVFQREQQLKQQYQLKHQVSTIYTPVYYPSIPPYSGNIDHQRASQMNMFYHQQQQQQMPPYYSPR